MSLLRCYVWYRGIYKMRKELDQSNPENNCQTQYAEFQRNLGGTCVGDEVRCFSGNGGLRNWEEHDDPWLEHCKWFPACIFARETKGDAFIQHVQQSVIAPTTMLNDATSAEVHDHNDLDLDVDLVTMKTICMEEMGFTADIFDKAVYHLQLDGNHHPNIEDIITGIDQIQKETAIQYTSDKISESFNEENKRLKSIVKCSKCKINDSNALFLPCAHHVMCITCARDMKRCSVCNRGVSDVVRTYMGLKLFENSWKNEMK